MAYTDVVSGTRTVASGLAAIQKPDIDSVLKVLEPYKTPLMQYLFFSGMKSKVVEAKTAKFSWFEDELFPHQTKVTAAINLTGATIVLTAANCAKKGIFKLNDIVYIECNNEQAYVTSVTAGGGADVVLTHIDGSTSLTAIAAGGADTYLKIIGSTFADGAGKPTAMSTKPIEKYNYLTIYKELVSNTGRDQAGKDYTEGTSHAEQVAKKMKEMKLQYERNFLFSKVKGSVDGRTYGEGMNGRFTTNVTSYAGVLTETTFDAHLYKCAQKGTGKVQHYCGPSQFDQLTAIVKNKIGNLQTIVTSYGARLVNYTHSLCDVEIVSDYVMDGQFANWGFTVDKNKMVPRHMANDKKGPRKFRTEANVETPGSDSSDTLLMADIGLQLWNEETGGILKQN